MGDEKKKDTIVLYPAPGIGHLVSMVELGKLILAHRSCASLSLTILLTTGFLDTPATAAYVRRVSAASPAVSFLRLPFQPSEPPGPTLSRAAAAFRFIRLNRPHVARALRGLSGTVRALVIDLFCTSALDVAREMGIPAYYFFTSGAAVLAAFLRIPAVHGSTEESFKDMGAKVIEFPGIMPPLRADQMVQPMLDRADPAYWDFLHFCSTLPKSDGIIVNTFAALESVPIASAPPTYYVGPLIAEPAPAESDHCLAWLDAQPSQSVVFLCFGSRGTFTAAQAREIAAGIESSGHRFLWVVKRPPVSGDISGSFDLEEEGVFPPGFEDRTRGRGLAVKSWAPQREVLGRGAVGGFVTHCGWNSVLEAVAAGVPMAAWPLYAEQHMNRNVMVDDLGIAVEVGRLRGGQEFVTAAEVECCVRELMESDRGREVRQRCLRMKAEAEAEAASSARFGSSAAALDNFIASVLV